MAETEFAKIETNSNDTERREFLNASFALLKGLSIHDVNNEAIERPKQNFFQTLEKLRKEAIDNEPVEMKYVDGILSILGSKLGSHFSTVEASKLIPESMELALIESIRFKPEASPQSIGDFFSKWALHCSVNQKSRQLIGEFSGIEIEFIDPEKVNLRLKSKQMLLSPAFALNHYSMLFDHAKEFFEGIASNKVISQSKIRRELLEMLEIGRANPYQLVVLSLIRSQDFQPRRSEYDESIAEAIATALLTMSLARELQYSIRDQLNLGVVGLLYNIGLLSQELSEILKSDKRLSQVDYKRIHDAQASGVFKLIRAQGTARPALKRLLAMFEATQGSSKASVSINLDSRILRLVSQYVALTSDRPYRDAYQPSEALKLLGSRAADKREGGLDPVVYYVFVRFMGLYPVGSLVLLSDGRKGIIYRPSGEKASLPMIKLIEDGGARSVVVDLASEERVSIAKCLDPSREGIKGLSYFFE